jgi:hypothetical protein
LVVRYYCRWKEKKWWRSKEEANKKIGTKGAFCNPSGV